MPEGNLFQMMGGNTARSTDYDHFLAFINDLHEAETLLKRWIGEWGHKSTTPSLVISSFHTVNCVGGGRNVCGEGDGAPGYAAFLPESWYAQPLIYPRSSR